MGSETVAGWPTAAPLALIHGVSNISYWSSTCVRKTFPGWLLVVKGGM